MLTNLYFWGNRNLTIKLKVAQYTYLVYFAQFLYKSNCFYCLKLKMRGEILLKFKFPQINYKKRGSIVQCGVLSGLS